MKLKRFTDLSSLPPKLLEALLAKARRLENDPVNTRLQGKVLALVFMNPSVRTLTSFQAGMAQLGGSSVVISPGSTSWGFEWRQGVVMDGAAAEHLAEAVPVLEQYADALALRSFGKGEDLHEDLCDPVLSAFAGYATKPFINMESATGHPCQALADWKTLDDLQVPRKGGRFVLSWAYHPRPLPFAVPASVIEMAALRGMDVTVLRPDGFGLPEGVMERARAAAARAGGSLSQTDRREEALDGAHVLYAKSWQAPCAFGDPEKETALREHHRDWCVRESWFDAAHAEARFMHCLPVRRNVVVEDAVLDGPRSVVVQQAGNRLHVQKAVLTHLMSSSAAPQSPDNPDRQCEEVK